MNAKTSTQPTATSKSNVKKMAQTSTTNNRWRDPFIEELHETRHKLLAKAGNNMHQLIQNAQLTAIKHGFIRQAAQ